MSLKKFYGTGRRKTSSSRVWICEGKGCIQINKKDCSTYFNRISLVNIIYKSLSVVGLENKFDVMATVRGGGLSGQAGAISLGIVRAVLKYNTKYKFLLKKEKLTTRDSRVVERKKYGQAGARKKFQYSKR